MNSSDNEELKRTRKQINKIQIMGVPGAILIGLGLFGIFEASTNGPLSILSNKKVTYGILAVGIASEVWLSFVVIPLLKKHARLLRDRNT